LYERWIDNLTDANVPIGTITVDAGWSPAGVWQPDPVRWPDLRGFVDRQHAAGRRVLLWIATWLQEGLPDNWCAYVDGKRLVANPNHPAYRRFLRRNVTQLLSPDGFDADGFKIDQLAYVPDETTTRSGEHFGRSFQVPAPHGRIEMSGASWGCELLYKLQKDIYRAAKTAKPDALITSSTVHPYFHDTFDMVRLHDTGRVGNGSVLEAMRPRADLARASLPHHPIDADDWIPYDYDEWLHYTCNSHVLGVPCIFYSERFVRSFQEQPTVLPVRRRDLQQIAAAWTTLL